MIPRPVLIPMLIPRVETIQTQGKQRGWKDKRAKDEEEKLLRSNRDHSAQEGRIQDANGAVFIVALITRTPERGKFWDEGLIWLTLTKSRWLVP